VTDLTLQPATGDDLDAVVDLLAAADLPRADVRRADAEFYLALDGELVGAAGLEPCGDDALLRSVVVSGRHRGEGYGAAVVEAVADRARNEGVERLYLLTTTAAEFFAGRGFERLPREEVPSSIRATSEFRELCPDSATCMWRAP
jgi:amino-acid N-acetyltransferase